MFLVVLGSKNHRFPFKFLLKSIDFESRAGSGAAGDRKIIDFLLNPFQKVSILSAGAAGSENVSIFY